jgi:glycerol uptake facilitator protein
MAEEVAMEAAVVPPARPAPAPAPAPEPAPVVDYRRPEAYAAEFLGTAGLVFFVTMVFSVGPGLGYFDLAMVALVHVFILAMLIHSLGGTSGAHFNPAVTLALVAVRKIAPRHAALYIVCQLAGGILGATITKLLLDDEGRTVQYGSATISKILSGDVLAGFAAEALGTFFLMWAIMGLAVNPRGERGWAGLIIGGTLGAAVMVFGPLTGAGLNPARALGPAVWGTFGGTGDFLLAYCAGPVVGAVAAALVYTALVLVPQGRIGERPVDHLA